MVGKIFGPTNPTALDSTMLAVSTKTTIEVAKRKLVKTSSPFAICFGALITELQT
jgi:hypothetical protein